MLLTFMVMIILSAIVHLFTVTWASTQAHARAREATLHDLHFLDRNGDRSNHTQVGSNPFNTGESQYVIAEIQGASGFGDAAGAVTDVPFQFNANADDTTRDDAFGANTIQVQAQMVGN